MVKKIFSILAIIMFFILLTCNSIEASTAVDSEKKVSSATDQTVDIKANTNSPAPDINNHSEVPEQGTDEILIFDDYDTSGGEADFIEQYVEDMVYMVYIDEKVTIAPEDEFLLQKAVAIANDYLANQAIEAVLLEEVEKIKRDQRLVFEEFTGEEISVIQWIAQKLNADVYITVNVSVNAEQKGKNYYAQGSATLTAFESSTGRLMGSKTYAQPQKSWDPSSMKMAKISAVQTCISVIIDDIIITTKNYMTKALKKGIKYELFLQGTADTNTIATFIRKLKNKVKKVEIVYRNEEEAKYYVWLMGYVDDLEMIINEIKETIPGLEGMKTVSLRGKSITFNTGL